MRSSNPAIAAELEQSRFDAVLLACPPGSRPPGPAGGRRPAPPAGDGGGLPALGTDRAGAGAHGHCHGLCGTSHRLTAELPWQALQPGKQAPAQFVFDRGHLQPSDDTCSKAWMAFVVSDCRTDRQALERQVLEQARQHWVGRTFKLLTVVENAPHLLADPASALAWSWAMASALRGDYVNGPTRRRPEGAVRCAITAADELSGWTRAEQPEANPQHNPDAWIVLLHQV
jgi:hypothetical protein